MALPTNIGVFNNLYNTSSKKDYTNLAQNLLGQIDDEMASSKNIAILQEFINNEPELNSYDDITSFLNKICDLKGGYNKISIDWLYDFLTICGKKPGEFETPSIPSIPCSQLPDTIDPITGKRYDGCGNELIDVVIPPLYDNSSGYLLDGSGNYVTDTYGNRVKTGEEKSDMDNIYGF